LGDGFDLYLQLMIADATNESVPMLNWLVWIIWTTDSTTRNSPCSDRRSLLQLK